MGAAARDWIEGLEGYEAFGITEQGNSWATGCFPFASGLVPALV